MAERRAQRRSRIAGSLALSILVISDSLCGRLPEAGTLRLCASAVKKKMCSPCSRSATHTQISTFAAP